MRNVRIIADRSVEPHDPRKTGVPLEWHHSPFPTPRGVYNHLIREMAERAWHAALVSATLPRGSGLTIRPTDDATTPMGTNAGQRRHTMHPLRTILPWTLLHPPPARTVLPERASADPWLDGAGEGSPCSFALRVASSVERGKPTAESSFGNERGRSRWSSLADLRGGRVPLDSFREWVSD
jgi:hypothetical protein